MNQTPEGRISFVPAPDHVVPTIVIARDYDGYFEQLVRNWTARKTGPFRHSEIHIDAGPYRSAAVSYKSEDGRLFLDFYSAIRAGFGSLSEADVAAIIEIL